MEWKMKHCIVAIWQGMVDASTLSDEEIDAELERGYADMKAGILEILRGRDESNVIKI